MDKSVKTALIGFLVVLIYTLFLWVDQLYFMGSGIGSKDGQPNA
jgi:hypothetical protein